MMFFDDGNYPRCGIYLRTKIIGMSPASPVYKAMIACMESEKLVKQALSPGTYPRLIIKPLRKGYKVINGIYQGECDPEKKNYVYLDPRIPDGYEENQEQDPKYFEKTLLHEVIHWGRFIGKLKDEIDGREAGNWFEHLAYNEPYVYHSGLVCPNQE